MTETEALQRVADHYAVTYGPDFADRITYGYDADHDC